MRPLLLVFCLLLYVNTCFAQYATSDSVKAGTLNKTKLRTASATGAGFYVAGISYLQFVWYKDHERVPFHFYNDAAGFNQIDKFGHAYGAYLESYIGYHWLRSAGLPRNKSLIWGGGIGFLLQAPIEIFDGMYEGWGFSWSDMTANAAGSGIVIANELLFGEQLVKYKFSFVPSPYRKQAHGYLGDSALESLFLDYNAHTYWLSMPLNKLVLPNKIPPWLNLAVGYSAKGMFGEFENKRYYRGLPIPPTERYRQFLLSADVDWTRIPTKSKVLRSIFKGMTMIKLPFPALEWNSKGELKFYSLYY